MTEKKTVKSCKNCTISEVWVQITGMPKENKTNPLNPYPLFKNLQSSLEKNGYQLQQGQLLPANDPVLVNIQSGSHNVSISPPFWNGEIIWSENNQKKVLRVGHQFFALHSIFNKNNPYVNYESSFKETLSRVMGYIKDVNVFEAVAITFRYVNTIEITQEQNEKFNMGEYFKTKFSCQLEKPLLSAQLNCEFISDKKNRVMSINTNTRGVPPARIINTIKTTGVSSLESAVRFNDERVFF